jgi:pimeloyl-ACP methyl ester carboxylesterase
MTQTSLRYFVARGETLSLNNATRSSLRGSFAKLSDGITHYELSGPQDGDVVLLIPGLTIPLFYWDGLVAKLHRQGLRTLAYSAYGRGYSDRIVASYDKALFVRQARELLASLNMTKPVHVIATSMGALIAMALLHENWFHAKSMTLFGPAGMGSAQPLVAKLKQWPFLTGVLGRNFGQRGVLSHLDHNVLHAEHLERLKAMVCQTFQYEGSIYALFSTLQSFPLVQQQELYRLTGLLGVPTLLAWGEEDRVTPITGMPSVKSLLKPVDCHVIPRCGHMVPFERPDDAAAIVSAFIA